MDPWMRALHAVMGGVVAIGILAVVGLALAEPRKLDEPDPGPDASPRPPLPFPQNLIRPEGAPLRRGQRYVARLDDGDGSTLTAAGFTAIVEVSFGDAEARGLLPAILDGATTSTRLFLTTYARPNGVRTDLPRSLVALYPTAGGA